MADAKLFIAGNRKKAFSIIMLLFHQWLKLAVDEISSHAQYVQHQLASTRISVKFVSYWFTIKQLLLQ